MTLTTCVDAAQFETWHLFPGTVANSLDGVMHSHERLLVIIVMTP